MRSKALPRGGRAKHENYATPTPRAHAPTLYIGARGVESVVACVLLAASCTHDVLVGAVANFLPSTVANFLLLAIAVISSYMCLCAAASVFKRSLCACVCPCGLPIIAWRVPALHG